LISKKYSHFNILFSKPCQRQYELLPSLGVRHLSSVIRIWPSGFRGDLKNLAYQKQELPVADQFGNGSYQNVHSLERPFHICFLPSFSSFGKGFSEEKIKNGNHMQFLFLIGRFLKKILL
jgi:hypothetical protein